MKRFEGVLDLLPKGHVFDGELVVLDGAGRPLFKELLFGRRRPTYVAFDLLMTDGIDPRPQPLRHRKPMLARIGKEAESWIALTNGIVGEGRALYRAVVDADLEGIVAKPLGDAYLPKLARWHKILNRAYSQRQGRAEWFRERRGRYAHLPCTGEAINPP
jgi:ATP-dependent DNA ligase